MIMPILGKVAKIAPTDPEKKRSILGLCEKPTVSKVPDGLSKYGWKRVAGNSVPPSETVEVTKTGIVKLRGSGLLPEMEVALQLRIAAADSRHTLASAANTQNKQLSGVIV